MSRRMEVGLYGQPAGMLEEEGHGKVAFRFSREYAERVPRPVLGQRFEDYELDRIWRPRSGETLPDFFVNLVPEGRLRELIEEVAPLHGGDDLGLLAFVGEDLPGAVTVRPLDSESGAPSPATSPRPDSRPDIPEDALRFSLAGVQLKFSMLLQEDKLVLPMKGDSGEWIVKFPSPTFPHLPENELAILLWARASGLEVPDCRLHPVSAVEGLPRRFAARGKVLAIRRYDRKKGSRIHQEDLAQVVGLAPQQKYDHVTYEAMALLVRSFLGDEGVLELIRRLTFVVASGNSDAHLKNWSLLYPDRVRPTWAPVYDQVATVAWPGVQRQLALKLAGVQEFHRIDRAAFERLAERAGFPAPPLLAAVDETLGRCRDSWREVRGGLPAAHRRAVEEHWEDVPLLRAAGTLD